MSDVTEFNPVEVAKIIAEALQDQSILPLSFIETSFFDRLNALMVRYMNQADVTWVISELKNEFLEGFTSLNAQKLHNIIHNCTRCTGYVDVKPITPSWNTADPDLMIVAENPFSVGKHSTMLTSALKDAGFSSQRCMLTYVTRCSVHPVPIEVMKRCLPYLHTEMAVVNPKLILTLGLPPYVAISGDEKSKLNDVRGSIFWFGPYAVLPESSLASGAFVQEKNQSLQSYLTGSLATAFAFLYGGK